MNDNNVLLLTFLQCRPPTWKFGGTNPYWDGGGGCCWW